MFLKILVQLRCHVWQVPELTALILTVLRQASAHGLALGKLELTRLASFCRGPPISLAAATTSSSGSVLLAPSMASITRDTSTIAAYCMCRCRRR